MSHKVSVLLPVYNGARHILEQLHSILNQSHRDLEILTVDDGSSDCSGQIISDLSTRDPRILNVAASGNRGQKRRLQDLLKLTTGDFVAFSDQDDIWHSEKIETLLANLGPHGLAFGRSEIIDSAGAPLGHNIFDAVGVTPRPEMRLRSLVQPLVSAHALLVRKNMISDTIFSRHIPFDWLLCLEASFSSGVIYVPEAIVYHRVHENNQNNASFKSIRVRSLGKNIFLPREIMHTGARDRFMFWNMLDYMGHSTIIPAETSRIFKNLAEHCAQVWFMWQGGLFRRRTPAFWDRGGGQCGRETR